MRQLHMPSDQEQIWYSRLPFTPPLLARVVPKWPSLAPSHASSGMGAQLATTDGDINSTYLWKGSITTRLIGYVPGASLPNANRLQPVLNNGNCGGTVAPGSQLSDNPINRALRLKLKWRTGLVWRPRHRPKCRTANFSQPPAQRSV